MKKVVLSLAVLLTLTGCSWQFWKGSEASLIEDFRAKNEECQKEGKIVAEKMKNVLLGSFFFSTKTGTCLYSVYTVIDNKTYGNLVDLKTNRVLETFVSQENEGIEGFKNTLNFYR